MLQFKEKDHSVLVLKYLCLCGELPYRSLYLLPANEITLKRTVLKLKKEQYVTVVGHGDYKTIRLTKKSFPIIKNIYPELLDYYLSITDNHHFRGGSSNGNDIGKRFVWRRHRIAEALCMFSQLNVELLPFEKGTLHSTSKISGVIEPDERVFYSSIEVKNVDPEQKYKTDFTRMLGVYFSPGGVYPVYNTNKRLMKWNRQGELKAKILVEDIASSNHFSYLKRLIKIDNAILFGEDYDMLLRILRENGESSSNFEFLSFDNVFTNIYYVLLNSNGKKQIEIMSHENWQETIASAVLGPSRNPPFNIDCDDFNDNKYTLLFLDGNIGRLNRFKQGKDLNSNSKFEIVCYPDQVDFMIDFFNNDIEISTVSLDSVLSLFEK